MKFLLAVSIALVVWSALSIADKNLAPKEKMDKKTHAGEVGAKKMHKGDCRLSCVLEWNPLCANNSEFMTSNTNLTTRMFENPCVYQFHNCVDGGKWHKLHDGECVDKTKKTAQKHIRKGPK